MEQKTTEQVSEFRKVYLEERPAGWKPLFSDLS